ncbi:MAG: hypothetical protein COZ15_00125, partial [Elusimicrobia bacterium CG_4_10_14_3_um_filter_49_12_50_7]
FSEVFSKGTPTLDLRLRQESVSDDNFSKDADALTLRARLGFKTASWNGFSAVVEAEGVDAINDRYNSTANGNTSFPTVADPTGTEWNQAYLGWDSGKGTALLSCFADKIFFMFQPRRKYKNSVLCKFPVSAGKPGRDEARSRLGLDPGKPLILILGGSQGSSFINDLVLRLLPRLGFAQIVHITGEADFMRVNAAYAAHKGKHLILPACHYMSILYSAADAAVSRAGAGTLADLAFYKIPSLLIPYPLAGAHQEKNADFFSDPPSAIIIRQAEVDEDKILTAIEDLVSDNFWKLKENLAKISLSDDGADLAAKLTA